MKASCTLIRVMNSPNLPKEFDGALKIEQLLHDPVYKILEYYEPNQYNIPFRDLTGVEQRLILGIAHGDCVCDKSTLSIPKSIERTKIEAKEHNLYLSGIK